MLLRNQVRRRDRIACQAQDTLQRRLGGWEVLLIVADVYGLCQRTTKRRKLLLQEDRGRAMIIEMIVSVAVSATSKLT